MARGKSSSSEGGKKRGRPATNKKDSKSKNDEDQPIDLEEASDNEDSQEGDIDTGELPVVPASVQSVKKIIVAPKEIRSMGWKNVQEVYLKHPRTNGKSLFLLCTSGKEESPMGFRMYEVLTLQQETRSWFVNDCVLSDGNTYVCTPVDPLFLVLHVLAQSSKTKPLVDHLSESALLPRAVVDTFVKHLSHKQLENIAVKKGCDDIIAFMYSEEKTLTWLSAKAEKVAKYLMEKRISLTESSVSSNFVKSSDDKTSNEDCLRYACDIVGEYIDDNLKRKLLEKLGLPILSEKGSLKRKNEQGDDETEVDGSNKKSKLSDEDNMPLEDYGSKTNGTPLNKATKVTAKEKVLQKAAQGSHSLLKFFSAKSK